MLSLLFTLSFKVLTAYEVRLFLIPTLQRRNWGQRGQVTCPRTHSVQIRTRSGALQPQTEEGRN